MLVRPGWQLRSLIVLGAALFISQPLTAQRGIAPLRDNGDRPSLGYARPPIHVIGNAATGPAGLTPLQTRHAYGFDLITNQGAGQTIAIVDAYDDPNIASDLNVFSSKFGLRSCTTFNGCFRKIYASGRKPLTNAGWALEISLDVEWAHAIAPQAKIILVEAASSSFTSLLSAVDVAVKNGASVVSMSFGGTEFSTEVNSDMHFSHNGVTFLASSGDSGNGVEYPAASPLVVAVGGTTLNLDANGNYLGETAWAGSGGGLSFLKRAFMIGMSRARACARLVCVPNS